MSEIPLDVMVKALQETKTGQEVHRLLRTCSALQVELLARAVGAEVKKRARHETVDNIAEKLAEDRFVAMAMRVSQLSDVELAEEIMGGDSKTVSKRVKLDQIVTALKGTKYRHEALSLLEEELKLHDLRYIARQFRIDTFNMDRYMLLTSIVDAALKEWKPTKQQQLDTAIADFVVGTAEKKAPERPVEKPAEPIVREPVLASSFMDEDEVERMQEHLRARRKRDWGIKKKPVHFSLSLFDHRRIQYMAKLLETSSPTLVQDLLSTALDQAQTLLGFSDRDVELFMEGEKKS